MDVTSCWAGLSYLVFTEGKHPAQAATCSECMNGTMASWKILKTPPSSQFPTCKLLLSAFSHKNTTVALSSNSHPDVVFSAAALHATVLQSRAVHGRQTAFKSFPNILVNYAKTEGLTLTNGPVTP